VAVSEQIVDLRSTSAILRRHARALVLIALLGGAVGAFVAQAVPNKYHSTAQIQFQAKPPGSASYTIDDQVLTALSTAVMQQAGADVGLSPEQVTQQVEVTAQSTDILWITATSDSPTEARRLAQAMATRDNAYVQKTQGDTPVVQGPPSSPTRSPVILRTALFVALGAGLAVLSAGILFVVRGRRERTLLSRDQIADAIGVPVVASLQTKPPRSAAGWATLLKSYEPGSVETWTLRQVLRLVTPGAPGSLAKLTPRSPAVVLVTMTHDVPALSVAPQLAAFAAATGATTSFVVAEGDDSSNALRAAVARFGDDEPRPGLSVSNRQVAGRQGTGEGTAGRDGGRSRRWLQARLVRVRDRAEVIEAVPAAAPGAGQAAAQRDRVDLVVLLAVLDRMRPELHVDVPEGAVTLLAVSSGAATAADLARLAVAADDARHTVAGVIVADPDPLDRTNGRLLPSERAQHVPLPTRMTGTVSPKAKSARRRPR
jgi:capsular polysaccharide biosynthesis protein